MNKTTLEGLEEALERLEQIDGVYSWGHLLFEVRETLAKRPVDYDQGFVDGFVDGFETQVSEQDHIANAGKMIAEPKCSDHPDAPHGFDRNASHNADRYVCECEAWSPDDMAYRPNGLSIDTQDQYEVGNLEDAEKFALNRMKQEPVAIISESAIGLVKLHSNGVSLPFGTQLYAAPVDVKAIIEELEITKRCLFQMQEAAKAIREAALEEAAKVCDEMYRRDGIAKRECDAADECAAAIRNLK
jgi:hypothetical protein